MQDRRSVRALTAVALGVVLVDHATKWLALQTLDDRSIDVGPVRLRLVFNRGAAFGLGSRFAPLLALVAVAVVAYLLASRHEVPGRWSRLAMGLVVGGAVGNLLDRLLRSGHGLLGGAVVDFVDLGWWPVFNVADAAITVGAAVLAVTAGRPRGEETAAR